MKIKSDPKPKKRETPPKFIGRFSQIGSGLDFGTYNKMHLKKFIKENPGMPFELVPLLSESKDQRGFFEGAVCPLVAFYQEGMDHHNSKDIRRVRESLKLEFNSEMVELANKVYRVAKSTKNELNKGFLERVVVWLIENYSPPAEVLDTKKYDHWKDAIFPYGGPDNYIDYLVEKKIL